MHSCPDLWDVLHDAILLAAEGVVPGSIALTLRCAYLRDRFAASGNSFSLILEGCTKFEFTPWAEDQPVVTSIEAIGQLRLWILSAEQRERHCQIHCQHEGRPGGGSLEVVAKSARLYLDTGTVVSLEEIKSVAAAYWTDFSFHIQTQPTEDNDLTQRIKGSESVTQLAERLQAEHGFDTELELTPGTLGLFVDRYLNGELSATELENVADLLEQRVEYVPSSHGAVIAQVLFEISSPDANGAITPDRAQAWKSALSKRDAAPPE